MFNQILDGVKVVLFWRFMLSPILYQKVICLIMTTISRVRVRHYWSLCLIAVILFHFLAALSLFQILAHSNIKYKTKRLAPVRCDHDRLKEDQAVKMLIISLLNNLSPCLKDVIHIKTIIRGYQRWWSFSHLKTFHK